MKKILPSGFMAHRRNDSTEPFVNNLTFFIDDDGKLSRITSCTIRSMSPKRQIDRIFTRDEATSNELDLSATKVEDLNMLFHQLALCNPANFKSLYYTLKEHDEKMFPIIQSVLEEIQQLFNFN